MNKQAGNRQKEEEMKTKKACVAGESPQMGLFDRCKRGWNWWASFESSGKNITIVKVELLYKPPSGVDTIISSEKEVM